MSPSFDRLTSRLQRSVSDFSDDTGMRPQPIIDVYKRFLEGGTPTNQLTLNQSGDGELQLEPDKTHLHPVEDECIEHLVDALGNSRLLLPIIPGETSCHSDGFVPVNIPAKRSALAVFSDIETMLKVYPRSRPKPLLAQHVCLAALHRGGRLLVDGQFIIPRPAVAAVAQGDSWLPSWKDDELKNIVHDIASGFQGIVTAQVIAGPNSTDMIRIVVSSECKEPREQVQKCIDKLLDTERLIVACDVMVVQPVVAT